MSRIASLLDSWITRHTKQRSTTVAQLDEHRAALTIGDESTHSIDLSRWKHGNDSFDTFTLDFETPVNLNTLKSVTVLIDQNIVFYSRGETLIANALLDGKLDRARGLITLPMPTIRPPHAIRIEMKIVYQLPDDFAEYMEKTLIPELCDAFSIIFPNINLSGIAQLIFSYTEITADLCCTVYAMRYFDDQDARNLPRSILNLTQFEQMDFSIPSGSNEYTCYLTFKQPSYKLIFFFSACKSDSAANLDISHNGMISRESKRHRTVRKYLDVMIAGSLSIWYSEHCTFTRQSALVLDKFMTGAQVIDDPIYTITFEPRQTSTDGKSPLEGAVTQTLMNFNRVDSGKSLKVKIRPQSVNLVMTVISVEYNQLLCSEDRMSTLHI